MNMTPKKILSLPTYLTGTTLGLVASILLLPGGFIMALAFGAYWLADRLNSDEEYTCDMTVEEFDSEEIIPVPFVMGGDSYGEVQPGFRFTLQQCHNCAYDDACLSPSDGWCDRWEEETDNND
jgi:hypothetical protein